MSDLGYILRKTRQEKKISLDDLQEVTKIRKRYLEAIEEGNYKVLPGSFYVRAFIKSYAEAVGLDPTEVLNMYQSTNPSPAIEKPVVEVIRSNRTRVRNTEKMSRWASSLMFVCFILLIFGIVYYYTYKNYKGTPADEKPTQTQTPRITDSTNPSPNSSVNATGEGKATTVATSTPTPTPAPTPTPPAVQVKFSSNEKGVDNYIITGTANLNIQFKIKGSCWIAVNALTPEGDKGALLRQKLYNDGDTDLFDIPSSAYLNVGAASALQLMVNGTLVPVGDTPNPKRVQLNLQKS
ncbi:helix-turn-helix domain-containing protein [Paenibacillus roseipurpureus]|uniref:Helix-turn-helix domain-containing protein n=1 Tax=Paenibacillus roseopurpureus TaxID=2918901 RepID=A0AA96LR40_9BACL|nr:helix-turn-helix domain-containing protein [Paenibacillus sp. MBLB1832]WNR46712.1 helix-turn-helix domain-containing protein [Paenibacillus sp. MBLB1832]